MRPRTRALLAAIAVVVVLALASAFALGKWTERPSLILPHEDRMDSAIGAATRYLEAVDPLPGHTMILLHFLRRRFALDAFAGMPERFDELLSTSAPSAVPPLSAYRRLLRPEHEFDPADLELLSAATDKMLVRAIYCDRTPLPDGFGLELSMNANHTTRLSHVGLALVALQDNHCAVSADPLFVVQLLAGLEAAVARRGVNEFSLAAAPVLLYLGHDERMTTTFLESMLASQQPDGSWSSSPGGGAPSSNTTALGLWTLLEAAHGETHDGFVPADIDAPRTN